MDVWQDSKYVGELDSDIKDANQSMASVIRQKDEFQNCGYKKRKHATFYEKVTFLTPWYAKRWIIAFINFKKIKI